MITTHFSPMCSESRESANGQWLPVLPGNLPLGCWARPFLSPGPRSFLLLTQLVPSPSLTNPGDLALCPAPIACFPNSFRFLATLLSRVRSSPHISDLCDVVHAHAVGPFSVYVDYVRNQQYQEETYSRLM